MNQVHVFNELSTGDAYDETQVNDDIKDGDIIVCNGGKSVAILVEAWPTSVKGEQGEFHGMKDDVSWETLYDGKYAEAYKIAMAQ